jgi:predicted phosphate transport protein (TIGR00153 family)
LEHTGDEITYKLFDIVNKAFAVPIDREDISKLADAIDDVLDDINETAQKFFLFRIQKPNAYMVELGKVMLRAIQEIYLLISQLQKLKDTKDLIGYCRNISEHEHQADIIYRNAIAELFQSADPIEIIKVKEIYEMLERIVDKCEDVSNILESIIVKYR